MAEQMITLNWDGVKNDVTSQPQTVDLVVGDTLVFRSDQGPINLKFEPAENFGMDSVLGSTVRVVVLKRAPARITCGVMVDGVTHGFPVEAVKTGVNLTPGDA